MLYNQQEKSNLLIPLHHSSELFQRVSDGEKIFVDGVQDSIPGFSITHHENDKFYSMQDNIMEIILSELIREDWKTVRTKDMLNDPKLYDRSYSLPEVLKHEKYLNEVHAYATKIAPKIVDTT